MDIRLAKRKSFDFKHPTKPGNATIPNHAGRDLPKRDVNSILKQTGLK
jgi:predicted RNA binding protein YcfA (HicA-like mRNA interferase family)